MKVIFGQKLDWGGRKNEIKITSYSIPYLETFHNVYLHGKLEDINGYDICDIYKCEYEDQTDMPETIEDVMVCTYKGKWYTCTLYLWHTREFNMNKGLICLRDDKEANEYAKKCYEQKVDYFYEVKE